MPELVAVIGQRQRRLDVARQRCEAPGMIDPGRVVKAVESHRRRRPVVPPAKPVHRKAGRRRGGRTCRRASGEAVMPGMSCRFPCLTCLLSMLRWRKSMPRSARTPPAGQPMTELAWCAHRNGEQLPNECYVDAGMFTVEQTGCFARRGPGRRHRRPRHGKAGDLRHPDADGPHAAGDINV